MKPERKEIDLGGGFRVVVDPHNHILEKYTEKINKETKESNHSWSQLGFFSTLNAAIKSAMHNDIKEASSLKEVLDRIESFEATIEQKLKGA